MAVLRSSTNDLDVMNKPGYVMWLFWEIFVNHSRVDLGR